MVQLAEKVSSQKASGFNGGDEGRIFRNQGGLHGITIGPGDLKYAHKPNEQISIQSVLNGVDLYRRLFLEKLYFNS
jgi:acetylornithine deacetylase/succinyl-diaminopimelate desuccinylase-like protein